MTPLRNGLSCSFAITQISPSNGTSKLFRASLRPYRALLVAGGDQEEKSNSRTSAQLVPKGSVFQRRHVQRTSGSCTSCSPVLGAASEIKPLRHGNEPDAVLLQSSDVVQAVHQGAPEAVELPVQEGVEFSCLGVSYQPIEARPARLGAANLPGSARRSKASCPVFGN